MGGGAHTADDRDDAAVSRDDAADARDVAAQVRDVAGDRRDADADQRDEEARQAGEVFDNWLSQNRRRFAEQLARIEEHGGDGAGSPDLTPDGLARLRAFAAEQRRLAEPDRVRIRDLVDALQVQADLRCSERRQALRDRRAAAEDRRIAAEDRQRSARDRALAGRDRDQSAIDREQVTPDDLPRAEQKPPAPVGPIERAERAVAESKERIAASRSLLAGHGRPGEDCPPPGS